MFPGRIIPCEKTTVLGRLDARRRRTWMYTEPPKCGSENMKSSYPATVAITFRQDRVWRLVSLHLSPPTPPRGKWSGFCRFRSLRSKSFSWSLIKSFCPSVKTRSYLRLFQGQMTWICKMWPLKSSYPTVLMLQYLGRVSCMVVYSVWSSRSGTIFTTILELHLTTAWFWVVSGCQMMWSSWIAFRSWNTVEGDCEDSYLSYWSRSWTEFDKGKTMWTETDSSLWWPGAIVWTLLLFPVVRSAT